MLPIQVIKTSLLLFLCFGLLGCNCKTDRYSVSITPTTTQNPEPLNSFTPQRIGDLTRMVWALEKYKRDHRNYPISMEGGRKWSRLINVSGEFNHHWIEGLVPAYMEELPQDPRRDNNIDHQYAYKSDGANYKLIASHPDDCEQIAQILPNIIDSKRACRAYGFWTVRAAHW